MGKLKLTAIRLDDEDLEKAQKLGINVSQVCRNAVKEAIRRMEGPNHQENTKNDQNLLKISNQWWGCPDLNQSHESPSLEA